MELEKRLEIRGIKHIKGNQPRYVLEVGNFYKYENPWSSFKNYDLPEGILTLDDATLEKFGIAPTLDLVGKTMVVTLTHYERDYGEGSDGFSRENQVYLRDVSHTTELTFGMYVQAKVLPHISYTATLLTGGKIIRNGGGRGGDDTIIFPQPHYQLHLKITEDEFNALADLPIIPLMNVSLRVE